MSPPETGTLTSATSRPSALVRITDCALIGPAARAKPAPALAYQSMWNEAMLLGGVGLFVGLLAWAVWRGTMRKAKP